ncbi:MAG: glycosyltransferase [Chitinophagaceae bacterium]|nr:MAG: glycosyltransferase [Chitinophagaceae bacterium]
MQHELPLVSVIVLTYNSSLYVLETLDSIKKQTYRNIELIITDDYSQDDTVDICKKWLNANRNSFSNALLVESDQNTGISPNCNRALKQASGKWIKLIAGDDALEETVISDYISFSANYPQAAAIFCRMCAYNEIFNDQSIVQLISNASKRFNAATITPDAQFEILLRQNCINAPTVIVKKEVVDEVGGFDEDFLFLEDWPMWLALTKAGYPIRFLDKAGIKYRLHNTSVQDLRNKKRFMAVVDVDVDNLFRKKYIQYLSRPERVAKGFLIWRNTVLRRVFNNKSNRLIRVLSFILGAVPSLILRHYRKRFV